MFTKKLKKETKTVRLKWKITSGKTIPADHAYALMSALCKRAPWLHDEDARLQHLKGKQIGEGPSAFLLLGANTHFSIAIKSDRINDTKKMLDRRTIEVNHHLIRIGTSVVEEVKASSTVCGLFSTNADSEEKAWGEVAKELHGRLVRTDGVRIDVGKPKIVRIASTVKQCYPLELSGLCEEDSLNLQLVGVGEGGHRFGIGHMVPPYGRRK